MDGGESIRIEKETFQILSRLSKKTMPVYKTPLSKGQGSNEEE